MLLLVLIYAYSNQTVRSSVDIKTIVLYFPNKKTASLIRMEAIAFDFESQ